MARVDLSPEALADLKDLAELIEAEAGPDRADGYLERLHHRMGVLGVFPGAGRRCRGFGGGLRMLGFERRAAILYRVTLDGVLVLRVLCGGRHWS